MTLVTACKVTSWMLAAEQHFYTINPGLSMYTGQYELSHHFCCCICTISLSSSICIFPLDFLIFKDNQSTQENLKQLTLLNIWLKKFTPTKVGHHGSSRCQIIKKHEITGRLSWKALLESIWYSLHFSQKNKLGQNLISLMRILKNICISESFSKTLNYHRRGKKILKSHISPTYPKASLLLSDHLLIF